VAIVAPSGAGTSTLTELIAGVRLPDAGQVMLDGGCTADTSAESLAGRAMLVRGDEIVSGTFALNTSLEGIADARATRTALEAVDLLDEVSSRGAGISSEIEPGELTRSERARLAIARAIAARPALLVIDGALDLLDRSLRERIFTALHAQRWTLVIATHDDAIAARCDRRLSLRDGAVVEA
jgi:predicted ABC-type transport system involved in lysophospholipase L1 biosynthesis ATPase subunit